MRKKEYAVKKLKELKKNLDKSLQEVDQFESESLQQIEENPFIQRNKDWGWRLFERITGIKEETTYDKMVKNTRKIAEEQREHIKRQAREYGEAVLKWVGI